MLKAYIASLMVQWIIFLQLMVLYLVVLQKVAEPKVHSVLIWPSTYVNFNFHKILSVDLTTLYTYSA